MKGLEIAQDFYAEWGRDRLAQSFPELATRVAIGRIFGSDVIGADDDISMDHNWGPQFTIFLSAEDYAEQGEAVAEVMNTGAPNPWKGFRLDGAGDKSVEVECIPTWMETWVGFREMPTRDEEWTHVVKERIDGGINTACESILYFLRHGAIWVDGSGEMSRWRNALHYYPDTIWRIRLAEELFRLMQHGEYNFVQRVAKRNDPLAKAICIGEFVHGVMNTLLVIHRDYVPYWKWISHEFRKLDEARTYAPLLEELVSANSTARQVEIVLAICNDIHQMLRSRGIINAAKDEIPPLPLFSAHIELLASAKATAA